MCVCVCPACHRTVYVCQSDSNKVCFKNKLKKIKVKYILCFTSTETTQLGTGGGRGAGDGGGGDQHFIMCKKHQSRLQNTETKRTINEYAKQTFNNNNKEIKGPSIKH